jgi:transcriptional regulator NrdR family protein
MIKSNDETITPFVKEKLLISIDRSLGHRLDHVNEAVSLTNTVVAKLQARYKTPLLDKKDIVAIVREVLKNFDSVATVYYSAYHNTNT